MGVVLFKAAFHGKSPFPSQAGKGLSTPYKEIEQQKSAVKADRTHLPVQSDFVRRLAVSSERIRFSPLARLKVVFVFSLSFLPRFSGKQAADGLFRLHPAEAAQIDGILRLAFSAVDHFVSRCVGEHLLHQKAAKGAVDLPEGQRSGLPAGIGQPARHIRRELTGSACFSHPAPPSCPSPISSVMYSASGR